MRGGRQKGTQSGVDYCAMASLAVSEKGGKKRRKKNWYGTLPRQNLTWCKASKVTCRGRKEEGVKKKTLGRSVVQVFHAIPERVAHLE